MVVATVMKSAKINFLKYMVVVLDNTGYADAKITHFLEFDASARKVVDNQRIKCGYDTWLYVFVTFSDATVTWIDVLVTHLFLGKKP